MLIFGPCKAADRQAAIIGSKSKSKFTQHWVFGVEKEIQLKRGEFFDLREEMVSPLGKTNSLMIYVEKEGEFGTHLVVEGAHNYLDWKKTAWEKVSATDLSQPAGLAGLPMERKGFYPLKGQTLPVTVTIPTWGLLHITQVKRSEGGELCAVLRYKRVMAGKKASN